MFGKENFLKNHRLFTQRPARIPLRLFLLFLLWGVGGAEHSFIYARQSKEHSDSSVSEKSREIPASFSEANLPRGEFLLCAGTAPDVTFDQWDEELGHFFFLREGRRFAFEPAEFLCWGELAEFSTAEANLVLDGGEIFSGMPIQTNVRKVLMAQKESSTAALGLPDAFDERIVWENALCGQLEFALEEVAAIFFTGASIAERERLLLECKSKKRAQDLIVFRSGERLRGEFLSMDDETLRFLVRELSPDSKETFAPETKILRFAHSQLAALLFSTELKAETQVRAEEVRYFWMGLSDGSIFKMRPDEKRPSFDQIPRETILYLESPQTSQKFFDTSITSAASRISEIQWLDERLPEKVLNASPLGNSGVKLPWYLGASSSGGRLRADGKICRHGIGTLAGTALIWKLDGEFETFGAFPALESSETAAVPVLFRVYADGKLAGEIRLDPKNCPETAERLSLSGQESLKTAVPKANSAVKSLLPSGTPSNSVPPLTDSGKTPSLPEVPSVKEQVESLPERRAKAFKPGNVFRVKIHGASELRLETVPLTPEGMLTPAVNVVWRNAFLAPEEFQESDR